jgi:hypothetical protein
MAGFSLHHWVARVKRTKSEQLRCIVASLDYILANFLTIEELSLKSEVEVQSLRQMMKAGCLPGPAYTIAFDCHINSVFGDHAEQLLREYFPVSHIDKAKAFSTSAISLSALAEKTKRSFLLIYKKRMEAYGAAAFGLQRFFTKDGRVGGLEAERFLEEEWQHYLAGTYGLCTRTATADDIATKEIMTAKIKYLTAKLDNQHDDQTIVLLADAVEQLDAVSAPFAPHEVGRSSRYTYIDAVREKYLA